MFYAIKFWGGFYTAVDNENRVWYLKVGFFITNPKTTTHWLLTGKLEKALKTKENQQNDNRQRLLIQNLKGVSQHHLHFGKQSKAGRGVGQFCSGQKGKTSNMPWLEAVGM